MAASNVARKTASSPQEPTLQYHPDASVRSHRLPFVGVSGKPRHQTVSFWDVPLTGGYCGGNDTGGALARSYLKHLSEDDAYSGAGTLQHIVLDMFEAYRNAKDDEQRKSLRGQIVGFFVALEYHLHDYARSQQYTFKYFSHELLCDRANAGLAGYSEVHELLKKTARQPRKRARAAKKGRVA